MARFLDAIGGSTFSDWPFLVASVVPLEAPPAQRSKAGCVDRPQSPVGPYRRI